MLEAQNRVGGRASTDNSFGCSIDLGCSIVTGEPFQNLNFGGKIDRCRYLKFENERKARDNSFMRK